MLRAAHPYGGYNEAQFRAVDSVYVMDDGERSATLRAFVDRRVRVYLRTPTGRVYRSGWLFYRWQSDDHDTWTVVFSEAARTRQGGGVGGALARVRRAFRDAPEAAQMKFCEELARHVHAAAPDAPLAQRLHNALRHLAKSGL